MASCNYIGSLTVHIERAMKLPQGLFGNMAVIDPYVKVRLDDNEHALQGKVKEKAGNDPIFKDHFNFELLGRERTVNIEIWDESVVKNTELARSTIRIDDLVRRTENKTEWFALSTRDGRPAGEILISTKFVGDTPEGKWPKNQESSQQTGVTSFESSQSQQPLPQSQQPLPQSQQPLPQGEQPLLPSSQQTGVSGVTSFESSQSKQPLSGLQAQSTYEADKYRKEQAGSVSDKPSQM